MPGDHEAAQAGPEKEAPTPMDDGAGAEEHPEETEQPNPAPSSDETKVANCLTDLPAVAAYLERIEAEPRGMTGAVVKEREGQYCRDLATVRVDKATGEVTVWADGDPTDYEPTDLDRQLIADAVKAVQWPEVLPLHRLADPLPQMIRDAEPADVFEFRDAAGQIVMMQVRVEKEGEKEYRPFTYWSDHRWRQCEPDGLLPLFNADKLKDAGTVFLHEGAKSARAMDWMVNGTTREDQDKLDAHPWGRELSGAAHIGWVGGALSPHRTDWSVLAKAGVSLVYIASDNDGPGREAVPSIARLLQAPTFQIRFNDQFPISFDLADPFPAHMFDNGRYSGPAFMDLVEPATWATERIDLGEKSMLRLRKHFVGQWVYADEPELFINTVDPRIIRSATNLSRKLHKFSDSGNTAGMLLSACEQVTAPAYRPFPAGKPQRRVTSLGRACYNVFQPSNIRPIAGDIGPWHEFLAYLCPDADERKHLERWAATLIARPDVRMHYGLLLVSERQGVGKGIFATEVLAPLVGQHNVSYPSDNDVTDNQFNDWMAHRRLVVIGEIYQGQSWKAYNRLKGVITDRDFAVNKKHQQRYQIENWCHVVACSNSLRCLKMNDNDRRWFYPQVAEEPWPRAKFEKFIAWLTGGGLNIIGQWAADYGDYVKTGERPPDTFRKQQMVEESRPEELQWVAEYCQGRIDDGEEFAISTDLAFDFVRKTGGKAIYSSKREFGVAMTKAGMERATHADGGEFFVKFSHKEHRVFLSPKAREGFDALCQRDEEFDRKAWLREQLATTWRGLDDVAM